MVVVTAEDIRDVLHASEAEVPDAKVLKMVKRVEVTLELELSVDIDYADYTDAQKLIEAGFEYVCEFNDVKIFRRRK